MKPCQVGVNAGAQFDLGFKGVVISDDIGQAKQVQKIKLNRRAIDFVKTGGNLI